MENLLITVFTPTYNRANLLVALYKSLISQTDNRFKWLIVDDGSTDDSKNVVANFIQENKLRIEYLFQDNQGKHVAHNNGVKHCNTELFFCVDSDDYLVDTAIADIYAIWESEALNDDEEIGGIVAYRGISEKKILGTCFPLTEKFSTLRGLYQNGKIGDTALIYKTKILKKFLFPVFKNENFLRESIVYNRIDEYYALYVLEKIIYICEYRNDGLSFNATRYEMSNPRGAAEHRYDEYQNSNNFLYRCIMLATYIYYMKRAQKSKEAIKRIGRLKYLFLAPFVLCVAIRYCFIVKKEA